MSKLHKQYIGKEVRLYLEQATKYSESVGVAPGGALDGRLLDIDKTGVLFEWYSPVGLHDGGKFFVPIHRVLGMREKK